MERMKFKFRCGVKLISSIIVLMTIFYPVANSCHVSLSTDHDLVELGSNVKLYCQTCNTNTRVEIKLNDANIARFWFLSGPVIVDTTDSELSLTNTTLSNGSLNLILTVYNFTRTMAGKYSCSIEEKISIVNILNKVPAEFVQLRPGNHILSVIENISKIVVNCTSSIGRPTPEIRWYIDNHTPGNFTDDTDITIFSTNVTSSERAISILTFDAAANDDGKRIYCNASNGYGKIVSDFMPQLDILRPPKLPLLQFSTCSQVLSTHSLKVIEGQFVNVSCTSTGNPSPIYTWHPNIYGFGHILILENISLHQNEYYSCIARNVMKPTYGGAVNGETVSSFRLDVLVPPVAHRIENQTRLTNTKLDIVCPFTAGNPEKTSFIWKRGTFLIEAMNGEHLIVKNISKSDEGWYTCKVFNRMERTGCETTEGDSESSFYLDVQLQSDDTEAITVTTPDKYEHKDEQKSIGVVVAASVIGVAIVVSVVVAIFIINRRKLESSNNIHKCLWWLRCRGSSSRCSYFDTNDNNCNQEVQYDDLVEYTRQNTTSNTNSETCSIGSSPNNKCEALTKTAVHEYSSLSKDTMQYGMKDDANCDADTPMPVPLNKNDTKLYENLKMA